MRKFKSRLSLKLLKTLYYWYISILNYDLFNLGILIKSKTFNTFLNNLWAFTHLVVASAEDRPTLRKALKETSITVVSRHFGGLGGCIRESRVCIVVGISSKVGRLDRCIY